MSRRSCRRTLGVLVIALCVPVMAGGQAPTTPEEFARRQYQSGLEFLHARQVHGSAEGFRSGRRHLPGQQRGGRGAARDRAVPARRAAKPGGGAGNCREPAEEVSGLRFGPHVVRGRRPGDRRQGADARQRRCGARQLRSGAAAFRWHRGRRAGARRRRRYTQTPWALPGGARQVRCGHDGLPARIMGGGCAALECRVPGDRGPSARCDAGAATCHRCRPCEPWGPAGPHAEHDHPPAVRPSPARSPYGFSGKSIAGAAGRLKDVSAIAFGPDGSLFVTSRTGVHALDQKGTTLRSICRGGAACTLRGSPGACAGGAEGAARAGRRTRARDADTDGPARWWAGEGARRHLRRCGVVQRRTARGRPRSARRIQVRYRRQVSRPVLFDSREPYRSRPRRAGGIAGSRHQERRAPRPHRQGGIAHRCKGCSDTS